MNAKFNSYQKKYIGLGYVEDGKFYLMNDLNYEFNELDLNDEKV